MIHETLWKSKTTGATPPARSPALESRQTDGRCRRQRENIGGFRVSVVEKLPEKRFEGVTLPGCPWPTAQAFRISKGATSGAFDRRPAVPGVFNRPLDVAACRSADPQELWSEVSPMPCLETPNQPGTKLSEAGKKSLAEKRGSDCQVETKDLAAYKKKPKYWGHTWFSSTKVGFCSFLTSRGLGHSGDRRRCWVISTSKTGFRPSTLLRYPLKDSGWRFMSACDPATSMGWTFSRSCGIFSGISGGMLFSFGTVELFTNVWKSSNLSLSAADYTSNGSRPMHQNSTLRNMSGTRTTPPSPTDLQATSVNLEADFVLPCKEYGVLKDFSGPVSMLPTCHGSGEDVLHYLCNTQ